MLADLGLTTYEERVYIALLKRGTIPARELSTVSEVPYGRIYGVLRSLESKGIVGSLGGRPQRFFAIPPDIAVNKLVESKTREIEKLRRNADILINDLNRIHERVHENELMWKVAIGDTLFDAYFSFLKDTKLEFLGYIDVFEEGTKKNFVTLLQKYKQVFVKLSNKNVKIRLLVGIETEELINKLIADFPETLSFFVHAEVRFISLLPYPFTVIDNEKVVLKVLNPINPSEFLAAIYLRDRNLAISLSKRFESLWEDAMQVDPSTMH